MSNLTKLQPRVGVGAGEGLNTAAAVVERVRLESHIGSKSTPCKGAGTACDQDESEK